MEICSYLPMITDIERSLPFYIATIGTSIYERSIYRPDGIGDYQILFPSKGKGLIMLNNQTFLLEKGGFLLLTPYTPHNYYSETEQWTTHWITFSGTAVKNLLPPESGIYKLADFDKCYSLFEEIHLLSKNENWLENSTVLLYRLLIWCKLSVFNGIGISINQSKQRLLPIIEYMNNHFSQPISLNALSALLSISNGQLCRLFRIGYNVRPMEYLNLLRLQKAKELLIQKPSMKISEIGLAVGYDSPSYFCKLFKKYEGITAQEFRENF